MRARRGTLYLADLSPQAGTEPGKVRPVLAIQTDLLNEAGPPSTWVLPCTTRLTGENLLRVVLPRGIAGNREDCEVMVDQSRAIDNRRLVRALKPVPVGSCPPRRFDSQAPGSPRAAAPRDQPSGATHAPAGKGARA